MSRRILLIPGMGYAHVTRTLTLARFIKDFADVKIVLGEEFSGLAEKAGVDANVAACPSIAYQDVSKGNLSSFSASAIDAMVRFYDPLIEEFQPDMVLTSVSLGAMISVKRRNIENVALVDACLTPHTTTPTRVTADYLLRSLANKTFPSLEKIIDVLPHRFRNMTVPKSMITAKITESVNKVAETWDISPVDSVKDLLQGDINLMPDIPTLFPLSKGSPKNYHYIGPLTWKEDGFDDTVVIDPDRPLVYLTMGSSGNAKHLKSLAKQLSRTEYQVVITTGNVVNANELVQYEREGFYVRTFLPGAQVVGSSRNTMVICHGGLGTVYQAFESGAKGVIVIPAHPEHTLVADRLEELGLGKKLWSDEIQCLNHILDEMYRRDSDHEKVSSEIAFYKQEAPMIVRKALGL